ncbi:hypothetical protein [Natrinema sp. 74]|uniref:hypothetical protein n=1 Tax=Natrinema sp. 74 TaxID=3384159 RepID=UPI0038D4314A
MVSSDGLETWFDYQLYVLGLAIAFIVVTATWNRFVASLGTLPLTGPDIEPTDPTVALAVTVTGVLVIVLLVALTGLLNRERP